jgi:hypothetical protein
MAATFPCPKCNRSLVQSGEVSFEGAMLPAYQCDECIAVVDPFHDGTKIDVALTFCVRDGKPFDPSERDGIPKWQHTPSVPPG